MDLFQTLLAAFSEKTGLDIEPGVDGSVEIEADGVFVTVQNRENQGDIVMFALPLYDVAADETMMRKALELSAHGLGTDGFFLGLADGAFVLSAVQPLEGFGAEDFALKMLALSRASKNVAAALTRAVAESVAETVEAEKSSEACNLGALRV